MLREGKNSEAKEYLQRSIDITPKMALELMKVRTEAAWQQILKATDISETCEIVKMPQAQKG